jgi:hypothetical protein
MAFVVIVALLSVGGGEAQSRPRRGEPEQAGVTAQPAYSHDPLDVIDTLGIRPGMTLAEAKRTAAKWGATIPPVGRVSDYGQVVDGPSQFLFTRRLAGDSLAYHGPHTPSPSLAQLLLFPKDPHGDIRADDNLVVYYLRMQITRSYRNAGYRGSRMVASPGGRGATLQMHPGRQPSFDEIRRADLFARARHRFSGVLDPALEGVQKNHKHCSNAINQIRNVPVFAQIFHSGHGDRFGEGYSRAERSAWRNCGNAASIMVGTINNGRVYSVAVDRFDYGLAEQAYKSLSQIIGYSPGAKKRN